MTPNDPTLNTALARLEVRLDNISDDLSEIKAQVKETNGRVTTLEGWRSRVTGFLAAIAFLGPVISGIVTALLINVLK